MAINPLPVLDRTSATFKTDVDTFFGTQLPAFSTEANATAAAMNLNSTNDTSATSQLIATGAKTFTVTSGKSFQKGMYLVIADTAAASTNSMYGQVDSYSTTQLVMNIISVRGSGTKTAWTISQSASGFGSAADIANTPAGGIGSTTVQGALNELDAEKGNIADIQAQTYSAFTTAGTLTAYTFTPVPAISAYAANHLFYPTFHVASGASPTFQISGIATPPSLFRRLGDGTLQKIAAGDIPLGFSGWVEGVSATQYEVLGLPAAVAGPANSALAGNRNRIINGACSIAQRVSFVASLNTIGYGGADRFYAANSTAGGQFTQSSSTLTFNGVIRNSVRQTVDTATTAFTTTNYWYGIRQIIEGFNAWDLKGKPIAVSFIFNTNLTGTYSLAVRDGTSGQSYVTSFAATANTPAKVVILIPAIPLAANIPVTNAAGLDVTVGFLNQATFQTATLNAWQTGSLLSASGATIWAATAGNFIELTELQLEEGTVATPFERRSYAAELALCQRYFETTGGGTLSNSLAANWFGFPVYWRVAKRVIPTTTLAVVLNGAGGTPAVFIATAEYAAVYTTATATGNGELRVTLTASAEL